MKTAFFHSLKAFCDQKLHFSVNHFLNTSGSYSVLSSLLQSGYCPSDTTWRDSTTTTWRDSTTGTNVASFCNFYLILSKLVCNCTYFLFLHDYQNLTLSVEDTCMVLDCFPVQTTQTITMIMPTVCGISLLSKDRGSSCHLLMCSK